MPEHGGEGGKHLPALEEMSKGGKSSLLVLSTDGNLHNFSYIFSSIVTFRER